MARPNGIAGIDGNAEVDAVPPAFLRKRSFAQAVARMPFPVVGVHDAKWQLRSSELFADYYACL